MRHFRTLLRATAAAWLVSWFLPVIDGRGSLLHSDLMGWQAFLAAIAPVFNVSDFMDEPVRFSIHALSAFTNGLYALLPFRARFGPAGRTRLTVAFTAAALLNLYWLSGGMSGLRIGYYVWAGSFVVMAVLLWRARGFATNAGS